MSIEKTGGQRLRKHQDLREGRPKKRGVSQKERENTKVKSQSSREWI